MGVHCTRGAPDEIKKNINTHPKDITALILFVIRHHADCFAPAMQQRLPRHTVRAVRISQVVH